MIDAMELRIGNWVKEKDGYTQLHPLNVVRLFKILDKIDSILLTPEILEKCGFYAPEKTDPFGGLLVKLWEGYSLRLRRNYDFKYTWDYYGQEIEIASVHQLQNLFYALCGKELEIKL